MTAAATHAHTWRVSTSIALSARWGTPPALYEALDREFRFTLDVAADSGNAKHVRYLTKDTDAFAVSWAGEHVFCNPPYGREIGRWMRKALEEARDNGALVVVLVPARTGTAWFHESVVPHAEVRFLRGRLSFTLGGISQRKRAPFDSMVVIYRPFSRDAGRVEPQQMLPFLRRTMQVEEPLR